MPVTQTKLTSTKIQESEYSENSNLDCQSQVLSSRPKKQKEKQLDLGQIVQGKWSDSQKIKYILFVYHYSKLFKSKTKRKQLILDQLRNLRVFKTLSEFISTRTPRQCRSHFQKLMNRFKSLKKIIDFHQNQLGQKQFLRIYHNETQKIQSYSLQKQNLQKNVVTCQQIGCQTQFPNFFSEYWTAVSKLKYMQNMHMQSTILVPNQQNSIYSQVPVLNYFNF